MEYFIKKINEIGWSHKTKQYLDVIKQIKQISGNTSIEKLDISIVIISNRYTNLVEENIKRIKKYTKVNFEIIFVNNGIQNLSSPILMNSVSKYIELKYNTGAYLARNIGAIFCEAPITLFLEDDGLIDNDLVNSYVSIFKCYDIEFVRGVCLPLTENPLNSKQNHYYLGDSFCPSYINLEGNCCIVTDVFWEIDGWDDEIFFGGGGPDLSIRLLEKNGDISKQIYSPISIIYHDYAKNKEHLKNKKEKQEISLKRLREKHYNFDKRLLNWTYLYGNSFPMKINLTVKKENLEDLKILKEEIVYRNFRNNKIKTKYNLENFSDSIELLKILEEKSSMDIFVFGAGGFGIRASLKLAMYNIQVKGFIDNSESKIGKYLLDLQINSYNSIDKDATIIIASDWNDEIYKQLIKENHKGDILVLK